MPLVRTTIGLLVQEDFPDLSHWTNDGVWAAAADPTLVAFDPSPLAVLTPGATGASDATGVRQGQLYVEGDTWYLVYDGGDGTHGWTQNYATSTDQGLTWTRQGVLGPGYTKGGGGTWPGVSTGWLEKRGSTYYLYRVTCTTIDGSPYPGLTISGFGLDIWSASSIGGMWTYVGAVPLTAGSWEASQILPGSVFFDGTTYHLFAQGDGDVIGRFTSATAGGPWTRVDPVLLPNPLADGRTSENPKAFYHAGLGRYCLLCNLIAPSGDHTDQTLLLLSASLTDWSAATSHRLQHVSPLDGLNEVGVITHCTGPDGSLVAETDGSLPALFDGLSTFETPGWHFYRTIRAVTLEPSASCARYTSTDSTIRRLTQTLAHTDVVAEWICEFRAFDATNGALNFEFRRQDANNYYVLNLNYTYGLILYKVVAGVATDLGHLSAPTQGPNLGMLHRIRLVVSGMSIQAWCDGEQQINLSDATYASGGSIAFAAADLDGDVRRFHVRASLIVTVNGEASGTVVTLRGPGGIPLVQATAGGGPVSLTTGHSPAATIQVGSLPYTPPGSVWGGDNYTWTPPAPAMIFG